MTAVTSLAEVGCQVRGRCPAPFHAARPFRFWRLAALGTGFRRASARALSASRASLERLRKRLGLRPEPRVERRRRPTERIAGPSVITFGRRRHGPSRPRPRNSSTIPEKPDANDDPPVVRRRDRRRRGHVRPARRHRPRRRPAGRLEGEGGFPARDDLGRTRVHLALQRQGPDRLGLRQQADKDGKVVPNKAGEGYRVEDGVIYSTKEDGGNLYTEKEYANFDLRFEFKLTTNANNGIGIRAPLEGDSAYVGMEIQVLDDDGPEYKNLRPAQYHGSIYDVFPAKRGSQKPVGEWNTEEIVADGRHVTVTVNGQKIVDANLDDAKDPAVLKKHPGLKTRPATSASSATGPASSSGTCG